MTWEITKNMRSKGRYVLASGILSALLAGCASSTAAPAGGPAQTSTPTPTSTTQTQRPTQVVSNARLQQLATPLDVAVPIAQGELTPVSKDGYEGWYTSATTQEELVQGVLADWQAHLMSQGYEVVLGNNKLDAKLKGTDTVGQTPNPTVAQEEADEAPSQGEDILVTPVVPPTDTRWVQVRVLSSTGSEHTANPGTSYIVIAYLSRA